MIINIIVPGLEAVILSRVEQLDESVMLFVEIERKVQRCPHFEKRTTKAHGYRIQKILHLKWFERKTQIFYKRRRYACEFGKRFSEKNPIVQRYQRTSIEWNQAVSIRAIKR